VLTIPLTGARAPRRILALGCHADDIEIGCGATLLTLVRGVPELEVFWVVLGATGERAEEARRSAGAFLGDTRSQVVVHDFRDGFFPYVGGAVKEVFEGLKELPEPDLIFTHAREDLHQDHRLACELTWNTFRDHLIFEYEIPKYDGDLGRPNVFVPLEEAVAREKTRLVVEGFPSQRDKHWFSEDLFLGLMRLRGMEACAPGGYAEAFTCRKLSLGLA
jgi:LmbE family N-acetylglucosaminyl deacetylase